MVLVACLGFLLCVVIVFVLWLVLSFWVLGLLDVDFVLFGDCWFGFVYCVFGCWVCHECCGFWVLRGSLLTVGLILLLVLLGYLIVVWSILVWFNNVGVICLGSGGCF